MNKTLKLIINSPGSLGIRRSQSLTDAGGTGAVGVSWVAPSSNIDGGVASEHRAPIETGKADKLAERFKQSADQGERDGPTFRRPEASFALPNVPHLLTGWFIRLYTAIC